MQKHAVTIRGHRTSISLELEFWEAIKIIAAHEQKPLAALIAEIDVGRGPQGLSSAIRVYVLKKIKKIA